ncbi:MAG TPA: DUF2012 domain-containing protein [Opitutaceae bacterium]|nr:DUF2012 domain-containing protein [Opitutaceae bacterium]
MKHHLAPLPQTVARLIRALIFLSITCWSAQAQAISEGGINGRVTNATTNTLLEGARVRIVDLNRETVAGRDGSFNFSHVPAGPHTLRFSYEGVAPQDINVQVVPGEIVNGKPNLRRLLRPPIQFRCRYGSLTNPTSLR